MNFWIFVLLVCNVSVVSGQTCSSTAQNDDHMEALIGYKILHHYLGKEAQLRYLHWLRGATFRGPTGEMKRIFTLIHQTSRNRTAELERLWKLEPNITVGHALDSKIGSAIQGIAEWSGTVEMVSPTLESTWDIRFALLQAMATRMVASVASSVAGLDTNKERVRWLKDLAAEYEFIREQIVNAMENCHL